MIPQLGNGVYANFRTKNFSGSLGAQETGPTLTFDFFNSYNFTLYFTLYEQLILLCNHYS